MSEPDKIRETLEEHTEQLQLESERISTLIKQVQQLDKVVRNLAKTVQIYGSVLPNVQSGYPYWSHDSWKQSLAKYKELNEELTGLVNQLSDIS